MPRPKEKPAIILDFDRVLFDTHAYLYGLRDAVHEHGASRQDWDQAYADRGTLFNLTEMAERLSVVSHRPAELLLKAMEQETEDALWYLYADSRSFLERFARLADLYLLTYGDAYLQSAKIRVTGIGDFFEGIQIVGGPKADSEKLPISPLQRVIFVNDNLGEMLELGRIYRWAMHLQILRPPAEAKAADSRIPVYQNLGEAGEAIARLLDIQTVGDGADRIADQSGQGTQHKKLGRALGQ